MQPFACSAVLVLVLVHDLVNQLLRLRLALTNIAGVPEILTRMNDHVAPDRTSDCTGCPKYPKAWFANEVASIVLGPRVPGCCVWLDLYNFLPGFGDSFACYSRSPASHAFAVANRKGEPAPIYGILVEPFGVL